MSRNLRVLIALVLLMIMQLGYASKPGGYRTFSSVGYGGYFRFSDPELLESLENVVRSRIPEDYNGFPLVLNEPVVWIFLAEVTQSLPSTGRDIEQKFPDVSFTLPVMMGPYEGDLQLAHFTNQNDVFNPYLVNYHEVTVVDFIDVSSEQSGELITLGKDEDIMVIEVVTPSYMKRGVNEALLKRQASSFRIKTDFPHPLDWGCSQMDWMKMALFCFDLESKYGFVEGGNDDPNVCNANQNIRMTDDGMHYEIIIHHMNGYFRDQLWFLADRLPLSTEYAFFGEVTESVDILYPCV